MEVHIIFKDATAEKIFTNVCNIYTKAEMLVVCEKDDNGDKWLWKYPLMNIFSVCHKHGEHWGSEEHKKSLFHNRKEIK